MVALTRLTLAGAAVLRLSVLGRARAVLGAAVAIALASSCWSATRRGAIRRSAV